MYFRYFAFINPWKMTWPFICIHWNLFQPGVRFFFKLCSVFGNRDKNNSMHKRIKITNTENRPLLHVVRLRI